MFDVNPRRLEDLHLAGNDFACFVTGIIQNLNLMFSFGVIKGSHGINHPLCHVHLIVDGKLGSHHREIAIVPLTKELLEQASITFYMPEERKLKEVGHHVAINAIDH
jgi:hypothetical protein